MTTILKPSLLAAPLLAALVILAIGVATHRSVRNTLAGSIANDLETVLEANVTALEIWIQTQERTAAVLAQDPELLAHALILLQTQVPDLTSPDPASPSAVGEDIAAARRGFQTALERLLPHAGYGAAQLVDPSLQIVATAMRGRPGSGSNSSPFFRRRGPSPTNTFGIPIPQGIPSDRNSPAPLRPNPDPGPGPSPGPGPGPSPGSIANRVAGTVPQEHASHFEEMFVTGHPVLVTPFKATPPRGGPPGRNVTPGPRPRTGDLPRPTQEAPSARPPWAGRPELRLMQVIAPVRNQQGTVLGAVAFSLRPEEEFTGVLSVARPGHSGETFAFDASGLLISQSRFDEALQEWGLLTNSPGATSALSLELRDPGLDLRHHPVPETPREHWPLIPMVAAALSGTNDVSIVPSPDYRGVPVVGAWRWLPDRRFGVVTKIDADEVFQPLRVIERIFGGLLGLLALASVGFVSYSQLNSRWRRRFQEAQLKARRLGQYTLDEKIGEGCMGVVYRAHHALLRRHTAIKLLLPHQADALLIRQFEHEVRLTCQLSHPNTIQVYDYGHTPDGIFYYAMELLQGLTLQELVERTGAQPEGRVLHFLAQICGSLQEAHAAGLIHRDIKPGNLFVCQRGGIPDTIKVLDFGLVQRLPGHSHSPTDPDPDPNPNPAPDQSRFLGTPLYLAPESIRTPGFGNPQTDLYALGAVGYFLLCGQPVFQCDDLETLWDHHLNVTPLPPGKRTHLPISHETETAILACLEKDPANRPASVTTFLEQLQRSPVFGTWNTDQQRAWWNGPGRCLSTTRTLSPTPTPTTNGADPVATLRIDLDHR